MIMMNYYCFIVKIVMSKYSHWPFNHPDFYPPKRLLSPPSCLSPTHLSLHLSPHSMHHVPMSRHHIHPSRCFLPDVHRFIYSGSAFQGISSMTGPPKWFWTLRLSTWRSAVLNQGLYPTWHVERMGTYVRTLHWEEMRRISGGIC